MNSKHPLVVGGTVLGAASACFLVWLAAGTDEPPDGPAAPGAAGSPASLEARAPLQTLVDAREGGAHRTLPAPLPPTSQSQPDLEALLHRADSAEGEAGRRETAARIDETIDEAWHRVGEDPTTALAWAFDQDGDMARTALQVVLGEWAYADPAAAFEAVSRMGDGGADSNLRAYGLSLVVESWAAIDPAAALEGVEILPSSPGTTFLRGRILTLWAENDPANAAASLEALVNESASGNSASRDLQSTVSNVAYRLAREYEAEAADWALALPEGSGARTSALAGVVSGWMDDNPQAAGALLDRMEPGAARDAGVLSMLQAYATEAPETALAWAETISDEAQRSSLYAITAARWLSTDPGKAEAWIRTATVLTDEQRNAIFAAHRLIPKPRLAIGPR